LYWSKKRRLRKKVGAISLHFGKAIHKFVEGFWMKKPLYDCINEYMKIATEENSPLSDDPHMENQRSVQRGMEVCTFYAKNYMDALQKTEVLKIGGVDMVEVNFAIPIGHDEEGWTYVYSGRVDRIEKYQNEIRIVDTKHTTRMGATYWNALRPNNQITGYWYAVKNFLMFEPKVFVLDAIFVGEPRKMTATGTYKVPREIQAMGQDAIEIWMANVAFEQGGTRRNEDDLKEWETEMLVEGRRMRRLFQEDDMQRWVRRTSQCLSYGECMFRDLCTLKGGENADVMEELYEHDEWSPIKED
jgi:hypothetical protein